MLHRTENKTNMVKLGKYVVDEIPHPLDEIPHTVMAVATEKGEQNIK